MSHLMCIKVLICKKKKILLTPNFGTAVIKSRTLLLLKIWKLILHWRGMLTHFTCENVSQLIQVIYLYSSQNNPKLCGILYFLLRQTPCRQFCSLWSASMRRRSRLLSSASGWCTSRSCSSCANSWLQTDRACRYRSRSPCSRSTAAGRDWAREECHHHPAPSTACASGVRRGEVSVFGGNKCVSFSHGEIWYMVCLL